MKRSLYLIVGLAMAAASSVTGQQVADSSYCPLILNPAYEKDKGPVVFIDEGHFNFHTKNDRFFPFAKLLERDGYRTEGYAGKFNARDLKQGRILVISNALNEVNTEKWYKPVMPAFTAEETEAVRLWVWNGGSLFLIADHMPFGGAASELAAAFGFGFTDGFALDTVQSGPAFFYRTTGTLADNVITRGREMAESVDTVASFTGQAFTIPDEASPILTFDKRYTLLLSDTAWVFDASTRFINIEGWSQAAFMKYGRGRVVVAGEAAMFTAQLAGPQKIRAGMNSPIARENHQLLLNIIHWLDGLIQ